MLIKLLAERNLMVKRMIPHLKRMCMERDVVLSYVDLRWGVTDVQGEQAAAVLMCLRELDKSNLFVGSFGERYGMNHTYTHKHTHTHTHTLFAWAQ